MPRSKHAQSLLKYEDYQRVRSLVPNLHAKNLEDAIAAAGLKASSNAVAQALPLVDEALRDYLIAHLWALLWAGVGPWTRVRKLEQAARRAKTEAERKDAHDKAERLKLRLAEMKAAGSAPARHGGDSAMPELIDVLLDAYLLVFGEWPTVDSHAPETAAVRFVCAVLGAYADQITGDLASVIRPSKLRLSANAVAERIYASTFVSALREARRTNE